MHALVHEEALARRAALAGAEEGGGKRGLRRARDLRVLEHDEGPFPPISRRSAFPAARSATRCPVSTEPMNATACVPGLEAISSPTTGPGPVTRLSTPAGTPASATHSARATAHTDVEGAAAQTTALPAASAGAITSAGIVYGQFHGVMTPTTPRGAR